MTAYTNKYNTAKKSNPGLKDCVEPQPYYDTKANSCVKCPSDHPYFNLDK